MSQENDCCSICLENTFNNNKSTLSCSHFFHHECILTHFRRGDPKCPMCRNNPYKSDEEDEEYEEDEDHWRERQRTRISGVRERQWIVKKQPKIKKVLEQFRECKKEYIKTETEFHIKRKELYTEFNITEKRKEMMKKWAKYIKLCSKKRTKYPNIPFPMYINPYRFNT